MPDRSDAAATPARRGAWLDQGAIRARRVACAGPLAPLADSLARDLEPLLDAELHVPTVKARLSRAGGRCPRDGTMLVFDPLSPWRHRCAVCNTVHEGDAHHRWWAMGFHLWLAERAVHAAALHAVRGDPRHAAFAIRVLERYAGLYLRYPNVDNVLGPSRPFFSTYLESLWLLHLCVALDLLEATGATGTHSALVREGIVVPSAELIAGFDEGGSNRQVWNDAALLAAAACLGDRELAARAAWGRSGVKAQLATGLLPDGTWFEGENYHQFAHRGLWYCLKLMEASGEGPLPEELVARFDAGFRAPFQTALPDLTAPSRRDSQYAVSLRQWRFAEMAELGLARHPDDATLLAALGRLYDGQAPAGDSGRSRSTGEAERNEAPVALDRSSLGWKSLLFAGPHVRQADGGAPRSVLQHAQGFAIIRRRAGDTYVSLDYGHGGGGHGHPDRLNVMYVDAGRRWLDDPGTGSYVDPSLHWYRSTLAHCAPIVDGRSQLPASGRLVAWDERGAAGLVEAEVAGVAPGATFRRTLVVLDDYFVDELRWECDRELRVELPIQVDAELDDVSEWVSAEVDVAGEAYLTDVELASSRSGDVRPAVAGTGAWRLRRADCAPDTPIAWLVPGAPVAWWRAIAPGPPGRPAGRLHVVRLHGRDGCLRAVWSVRGRVAGVLAEGDRLVIALRDGTRHSHGRVGDLWHVELEGGGGRSSLDLGGLPAEAAAAGTGSGAGDGPAGSPSPIGPSAPRQPISLATPFRAVLGGAHYRRSESTWEEAGHPTATVTIRVDGDDLLVETGVAARHPCFAPPDAVNEMDNERPEVNRDGVQLHLALGHPGERGAARTTAGWLLAPLLDGSLRTIALDPAAHDLPLRSGWEPRADGYSVWARIPVRALGRDATGEVQVGVDVAVNETAPGRERRRGQLLLSGGAGEFVYLRGDRHDPARCQNFLIPDA